MKTKIRSTALIRVPSIFLESKKPDHSINQSTKQSTNQSINQFINQSTKQSTNRSINQSVAERKHKTSMTNWKLCLYFLEIFRMYSGNLVRWMVFFGCCDFEIGILFYLVQVNLPRIWRNIGRRNASVFPEPVLAMPITSRPDIMAGMACAWIGVGFV